MNQLAEKKDGKIFTDQENIMRISTEFYKKLYTTEKVCEKIQEKLLKNVKTKLSKEKQTELDKPFIAKEIEDAIYKLQSGKSPGLDGFPIEFYKKYWHKIKNIFIAYVNDVKQRGLSNCKNLSVTKLIYKKKQEKRTY